MNLQKERKKEMFEKLTNYLKTSKEQQAETHICYKYRREH